MVSAATGVAVELLAVYFWIHPVPSMVETYHVVSEARTTPRALRPTAVHAPSTTVGKPHNKNKSILNVTSTMFSCPNTV